MSGLFEDSDIFTALVRKYLGKGLVFVENEVYVGRVTAIERQHLVIDNERGRIWIPDAGSYRVVEAVVEEVHPSDRKSS